MLREAVDWRWSLPSGFADPQDTPSEPVVREVREVREETGYGTEFRKRVGCWDRERWGQTPKQPISIYKMFFFCRATGAR
jgi:ADP-ribose pyrophosphatase YjhB (NUDIX family)